MALNVETWNPFLDPMKIESPVRVTWEDHPQGEVRGRFVGPKCTGTTTIEVAYPLRVKESRPGSCVLEGIIPEPSFWDPETPFYYELVIELWDGLERIDNNLS